jgi:hypothetical protein
MKYLIAIHRPLGWSGAAQHDGEMTGDIDAINDEMVAANVRVFVGGLKDPNLATTIRRSADGQVSAISGPLLNAQEYVDGFWVIDVLDEAEALKWGHKAAAACRGDVEVRPFH